MKSMFSYPGRCTKEDCQRDSLLCTKLCNQYAMAAGPEFPPNQEREDKLLEALNSQIQILYGYFFGIGSLIIPNQDNHIGHVPIETKDSNQNNYSLAMSPFYESVTPQYSPGSPYPLLPEHVDFQSLLTTIIPTNSTSLPH